MRSGFVGGGTISRQQLGIQLDDLSAGPGGAVVPPHGEAKSVGDIGFLVSQSGSVRTSRLPLSILSVQKWQEVWWS